MRGLKNAIAGLWALPVTFMAVPSGAQDGPPAPEDVALQALALPPTAPSADAGACSARVNPRHTGCMSGDPGALEAGSFLPGGKHVVARVRFAGAPASGAGSAWRGEQLVVIAAGAPAFANGDTWKCLTCGISEGLAAAWGAGLERPQAFADGKRLLAGDTVFDCLPYYLDDERCTPATLKAYRVQWDGADDASSPDVRPRGLRLHPDGAHVGFNVAHEGAGVVPQSAYIGRLRFDADTGRYLIEGAVRLRKPGIANRTVKPVSGRNRVEINARAIDIMELSGFSADGREAIYIGFPWESGNLDMFAVGLESGRVRRLTRDPGYSAAVDASPDGRWLALADTRGTDRMLYLSGLRGAPPLVDAIAAPVLLALGQGSARGALNLVLLDAQGDRAGYAGQIVSGGDPGWSVAGVPQWSPDSTAIVYAQTLDGAPSAEPGGRRSRLLLARFPARAAAPPVTVVAVPDTIGWATPHAPGEAAPRLDRLPEGTYALAGNSSNVRMTVAKGGEAVSVLYKDYAVDGGGMLNGTEGVSTSQPEAGVVRLRWNANAAQAGAVPARRLTGSDGLTVTVDTRAGTTAAAGSMVTTVDGRTYAAPADGK